MELSKLNIKFLPGVGEKRAALLQGELGIVSYEDMIYHVPYKYIDRSRIYPVAELNARMPYIQIKARIRNLKMTGEGKARRMVAEAYDASGSIELVWFKGLKYLENQFKPEQEYLIFGQPSEFNHRLNIIHTSSNKVNDLLRIIDDQYVDTVNMTDLVEQAMPSILAELDPHSAYIGAKDAEASIESLKGSFSGIGVSFTMQEDTARIISVIKGGPSEKVGLLAGDRIVSVDGESIAGKGISAVAL